MVKIAVQNLGFSYKSTPALKEVTFTIETGSFVGVVGPNGAGKTTLLRCLSSLLTPQAGTIFIDGVELQKISRQFLAKKVSIVLTTPVETPQMKVLDIMATSRHPHTGWMGLLKQNDVERLEEGLDLLGIKELVGRRFSELSDGQRQKVLFARALAQEPRVLIVDEPTAHLDIRHQVEVMQLLRRMSREGLTIVAATHDLTLASVFCDTLILMKDGLIVDLGEPKRVLNENNIAAAYGVEGVVVVDILGQYVIPKAARHVNRSAPRAHVVCGGGTGLNIFKALCELDFHVTSGVIHEYDLDYYAALAVCDQLVAEKSYSPIGDRSFLSSLKLVETSDIVIDSGFPIGPINQLNLDLVLKAVVAGKKVFSLRDDNDFNIYGALRDQVIFLRSPSEISEHIAKDNWSTPDLKSFRHHVDHRC